MKMAYGKKSSTKKTAKTMVKKTSAKMKIKKTGMTASKVRSKDKC